ncbi:MAG TPA: hypothetical protein VLJ68_07085 [Chitinophagaceae bacterium]|nr:hypothetical protein [Chitinophagaceae bacterium]
MNANITPEKISIVKISAGAFTQQNLEISVLRLDTIHPVVSGNKWFKLRFELEQAIQKGKKIILTFGGAWSNHIVATACCAKQNGLQSIGIIRGEEERQLTPAMEDARDLGMELIFISREDYRKKKIPVHLSNDSTYIIEEGGYGPLGARGAATILDIKGTNGYSHICCAAGTGTTLAGLILAAGPTQTVIGISTLRNNFDLEKNILSLTGDGHPGYFISHDYHFGGYAKWEPPLIDFMNEWYRQTNIPSDFVYTGKLFFAIRDLADKKYFPPGSNLLMIHSGGLQGNRSLSKGTLIF